MDTLLESLQAALSPAYQLERELEGGGMSRVFLANDQKLGRKVVVKVLPPDLAAGVNRDRFRREIQFAAQLMHPHIVPLISAGETDELLYYTMPFIEGQSLRTELERGELSSKRVVKLLHDVIDALAYAHERGIVHRDIKPGNILTLGSHALVTDFGVAKAISSATPVSGMTSTGLAIGTPAYMAPEQLAADPAADHRVDIYAVGLLAYELLSGSSPFKQESPQATMAAQLTRIPTPLDVCCPGVSRELSNIVMGCLQKEPDRRYQSAKELLTALDNLGISSDARSAENLAAAGRGKSRRAIMVAAVATTAAAGAAVFAMSSKNDLPVSAPPVISSTPQVVVMTKDTAPLKQAPRSSVRPKATPTVDSVAIAKAMRAMQSAPFGAPSLSTKRAGANAAKPSLLIAIPRPMPNRPDLNQAARMFAEDLGRALSATGNYAVIPPDAIRRARMGQRDPRAALNSLNADLIVNLSFVGAEPKSLTIQMLDRRTGRTASTVIPGAERGSAQLFKNPDDGIQEALSRLGALLKN